MFSKSNKSAGHNSAIRVWAKCAGRCGDLLRVEIHADGTWRTHGRVVPSRGEAVLFCTDCAQGIDMLDGQAIDGIVYAAVLSEFKALRPFDGPEAIARPAFLGLYRSALRRQQEAEQAIEGNSMRKNKLNRRSPT